MGADTTKNHLFCFGYGYTADYLGHSLIEQGWTISGTTRSREKRDEMKARNINAHLFEMERPLLDPLEILDGVTHLLISTPPNDYGDQVFQLHGQELSQLKSLKWVGYLSTTGVYGDRSGAWVDETSEVRPTSKRGSRRAESEAQWLSLNNPKLFPVHIFRLAGIYGPGRSALDSVRAGMARRINKPGHVFGRIHVEDIVQVLEASMASPCAGEVYNVCDGNPAASHEVIEYACQLLGRPCPPLVNFEDANLAPITRSFYMDNRRVRNDKIKTDLGVVLKYNDYQAGLRGCKDAEDYALALLQKKKGCTSITGF